MENKPKSLIINLCCVSFGGKASFCLQNGFCPRGVNNSCHKPMSVRDVVPYLNYVTINWLRHSVLFSIPIQPTLFLGIPYFEMECLFAIGPELHVNRRIWVSTDTRGVHLYQHLIILGLCLTPAGFTGVYGK